MAVGRKIKRMDDLLNRFRMLPMALPSAHGGGGDPGRLDDTLADPIPARGAPNHPAPGDPRPYRPVLGNASQLEQLFLNLCLNALEAMDLGGELTIRVADLSQAGGSTLLVEVSDTG